MLAHYVYAAVKNGVVENTFIVPITEFDNYGEAVRITHAVYGFDAEAIEIEYYPVQIGDLYENGVFYRMNGEEKVEIKKIPTYDEQILEAQILAEDAYLQAEFNSILLEELL